MKRSLVDFYAIRIDVVLCKMCGGLGLKKLPQRLCQVTGAASEATVLTSSFLPSTFHSYVFPS